MENIKDIISNNIIRLRQKSGMTQLELAEKLNYSDKSVSKWERGESLPDITVMIELAQLFGVTLDYLAAEHPEGEEIRYKVLDRFYIKKRSLILGMSIMLVWLIATLVFVVLMSAIGAASNGWLAFIYAVPVSLIVWLVLNSIWFKSRRNYPIISLLMWSLLGALFTTFLIAGMVKPLLFTLGIPGQLIIVMWAAIGHRSVK